MQQLWSAVCCCQVASRHKILTKKKHRKQRQRQIKEGPDKVAIRYPQCNVNIRIEIKLPSLHTCFILHRVSISSTCNLSAQRRSLWLCACSLLLLRIYMCLSTKTNPSAIIFTNKISSLTVCHQWKGHQIIRKGQSRNHANDGSCG